MELVGPQRIATVVLGLLLIAGFNGLNLRVLSSQSIKTSTAGWNSGFRRVGQARGTRVCGTSINRGRE